MGKLYAGGIYVIAASKDGKTEHWAAATSPKQATAESSSFLEQPGRLNLSISVSRRLKSQS